MLKNYKNLISFLIVVLLISVFVFPQKSFAATLSITNGMDASGVIGQYVDVNANPLVPTYNTDADYGITAYSLFGPEGIALDTTNHRLFVSDYEHYRVLVFNLNSSNNLVDYVADYVIGQTNFTNGSDDLAQNRFNQQRKILYDPVDNYLYVADSLNIRVLVFDMDNLANGMNASYVIGQVNFTTRNCDPISISCFGWYMPTSLAIDPVTRYLYVGSQAGAVLVFNLNNLANNMNASYVLGQVDFDTLGSGPASSTRMNYVYSLAIDSVHHRLFVGDITDNRVLVFNTAALSNGMAASNVLGQANFTATAEINPPTQSSTYYPAGLVYDSNTDSLFVSGKDNRVLVFDVASITNGENAINVLGQENFTTRATASDIDSFSSGIYASLELEETTGKLYTAAGASRILIFDVLSFEEAVSISAIAGVTAPVTGATPVTTVTETAEYTGTVSWSSSPVTFASNTAYTATITLTPKSGYTLTGVTSNFFTVSGATATNSADAGVITAVFPNTATTISATAISGVTIPAKGEIPVTTVTAGTGYTGTVSWSGSPTSFDSSTVYTATITLTPTSGYTLTGVTANQFTIQGATATNSINAGVITAVFPATANNSSSGSTSIYRTNFLDQQNLLKTPTTNTTTNIPNTSLQNIKRIIKIGNIFPEVKLIQAYLNSHNYIIATYGPGSRGMETTKYGPLTKKAIIKFQKDNGLIPDGIVGPKTLALMK